MSSSSNRADILQTTNDLRPTLLQERFDWWRKGGVSGAAGEMVSRSRGLPMPVFDRTDRSINAAQKAYEDAIELARKSVNLAMAIQLTWLTPIHVATQEEAAQASDFGVDCLACARPVACTPVDPIREGFCEACSKRWRRAGKPDRVAFVRTVRLALDVPEALQA